MLQGLCFLYKNRKKSESVRFGSSMMQDMYRSLIYGYNFNMLQRLIFILPYGANVKKKLGQCSKKLDHLRY